MARSTTDNGSDIEVAAGPPRPRRLLRQRLVAVAVGVALASTGAACVNAAADQAPARPSVRPSAETTSNSCSSATRAPFQFPSSGFFRLGGADGASTEAPHCHLVPESFTWVAPPGSQWSVRFSVSPRVTVSDTAKGRTLQVTFFAGSGNRKEFFDRQWTIGSAPDWTNYPDEDISSVHVTFDDGEHALLSPKDPGFVAKIPAGAKSIKRLTIDFGSGIGVPAVQWPA